METGQWVEANGGECHLYLEGVECTVVRVCLCGFVMVGEEWWRVAEEEGQLTVSCQWDAEYMLRYLYVGRLHQKQLRRRKEKRESERELGRKSRPVRSRLFFLLLVYVFL